MRTVRVLNFKMFGELRQITLGIMNGCGVLFWAVVLLWLEARTGTYDLMLMPMRKASKNPQKKAKLASAHA